MNKKDYTVSEAAAYLHIGRSGVHEAIRTHRLPAHRRQVGRRLRNWQFFISAEDLRAYDQHRRTYHKRRFESGYLDDVIPATGGLIAALVA